LRIHPDDGDQMRCVESLADALAAGFADYWTKPIDFPLCLASLDAVLSR
jgi:CheY-like chemotaxis protein